MEMELLQHQSVSVLEIQQWEKATWAASVAAALDSKCQCVAVETCMVSVPAPMHGYSSVPAPMHAWCLSFTRQFSSLTLSIQLTHAVGVFPSF